MSDLSKKMTVERGVDPGRDKSGFVRVQLKCPTCKRIKVVRRADVKNRDRCRHCEAEARLNAGVRLRRARRDNHNKSVAGNVIGGLNRNEVVYLYLEADSTKSARIVLSNKGNRKATPGCSTWRWVFADGTIPLHVLDCYGREIEGDAFATLNRIDATIKLLKGD